MPAYPWINSSLRFEGQATCLRKLSLSDCTERYLSWLNSPEINKYSRRSGKTYTMTDIRNYVQEMNSSDSLHLLMGIFWKENSLHIGNVLLGPIDLKNANTEISNLIGEKEYWGKGVAVDADKQLIHYAFSKLNLHKITIGNIAPNKGATFMSRQLGFLPEAKLREQVLWEGKFIDVLRFGLISKEFYEKFPEFKKYI